jgi:AcrR family transcriptional regulator
MYHTRHRLVQATQDCLGRQGLAATTSRHIAEAADANLAAITYYFGSKDELVAAALLESLRDWLAPTIEVLAGGGEPVQRTMSAIQTLMVTFDQHRADAPVYLEALLQAPRMEPLRRGLLGLWDDLRRVLADQMRAMQGAGTLPSWVKPEAMASLFIAVANGLVLQVAVDPGGPELEAMAGQFGGLLLAAGPERPRL